MNEDLKTLITLMLYKDIRVNRAKLAKIDKLKSKNKHVDIELLKAEQNELHALLIDFERYETFNIV